MQRAQGSKSNLPGSYKQIVASLEKQAAMTGSYLRVAVLVTALSGVVIVMKLNDASSFELMLFIPLTFSWIAFDKCRNASKILVVLRHFDQTTNSR